MNRGLRPVIVGMLACLASAVAARAAEQRKSTLAFERLASLVGVWRGVLDGTEVRVTYTLTANGSA